MAKHIHLFQTESEFNTVRENDYIEPWLSYTEGKGVDYNDPFNGHEYVDLGLPSGLMWATCNVGANSPEEFGNYYAWGETETKDNYAWSTYHKFDENGKYIFTHSEDPTQPEFLEPEDDAARANMGGRWHMAKREECRELMDYTTEVYTTLNGVSGRLLTSIVNGAQIFFPATGGMFGTRHDARNWVCVWTSDNCASGEAYVFEGNQTVEMRLEMDEYYREDGRTVRGVVKP